MDRQKVNAFVLKGLLAVAAAAVPAAISGYFSYKSASAEADAAKMKAELTYETLVEKVNELQDDAEMRSLEAAKVEGRLDVVEKICTQKSVGFAPFRPPAPARPSPTRDNDDIADMDPPPPPAPFAQKKLPPRLDMLPAAKK